MVRLPGFFQWLVALVVLTSTPGLSEMLEGAVHAAVSGHDQLDEHHEADDCDDDCGSEDCTSGFFHTCRCNAPTIPPLTVPPALPIPLAAVLLRSTLALAGDVLPAHRTPLFRPPSVRAADDLRVALSQGSP